MRITFDFETRSRCDLKKSGAYKYSLDPSTQPTCLAIKVRNPSGLNPNTFLKFKEINQQWRRLPLDFRVGWIFYIDHQYLFTAHNAFFEKCIYENILVKRYGWPSIPPRLYRCTAAKAAACALPRSLEKAGEALKLSAQKDYRGYAAMMATCKPTKVWKKWNERPLGGEPPVFLEPEHAPDVWATLYEYCRRDVLAEEALDLELPDLSPDEQEIWFINQELNWRGLKLDIPTVKKIVTIMDFESRKKLKELDTLTMGLVTKPGARNSILEFLALEGIELPNLQAKTVDDKLEGFELSEDMRRLLEIRKALSKTSTRKYQAFLDRSNDDHRVRDIVMYHGASTGRDTGTGIQPHNFPRGLIKVDKDRPYAAVENVVECDHEMLKVLYGESLPILFSSILRNMIIASEGHELFVGDFSQIEVAVLWWLAGNERGLKALRAGKDPYKYQAAANLGISYEEVPDEGNDRQLGKAQVLGCGFGMGWEKFQKTAFDMYRLKLSEEQSRAAVENYRKVNSAVPELWKDYENVAVAVTEAGPEARGAIGKCRFILENKFLWVTLPSGRKLAYREPQVAWRETEYGARRTLEFYAVNSKTKKWGLERTWGGTLTENIVQAVARDLIMHALLRLKKKSYQPLLTVHDEAVCEAPLGEGSVPGFVEILCKLPPWAIGIPVTAKGWKGPRYRK